ncbi:glycoside hydrolase family 19 protein [Neorhizobium sp. JUb45]|uniref:glycoside hydrolase family 19 protein n=1 Tax=unclassified Neorhizobium TaxID=2629175 RepID=UPI001050EA69|nr:glycoside hydrolase family 19 protein [Neorhizobium sp. JUb45]TCR04277.1 chitinase class I [Neorhizobium sp. JUb45]
MAVDKVRFFDRVRQNPFGGRLLRTQVTGMETIVDGWSLHSRAADPALAYVMATAFHETAGTMQPVRETLAKSDGEAVARLERAFAAGRLPSVKVPYWRPDAEGKNWFGRGFVQLTHRRNYEAMSDLTGVDLVAEPALAMRTDIAARILIEGMRVGIFTGWRLDYYFCRGKADWVGARKIVNGTDRAELVAGYGRAFAAALG